MAVHTLGSDLYKTLTFVEDLWHGIDTSKISNLVNDFYPPISRVTSKSENKAFAWLYGRIKVEGPGGIAVMYPYREYSQDILTLKNISFSQYPFISIKAYPDGSEIKFEGWFNAYGEKLLCEDPILVLSKGRWPEVTGFIAKFSENESDLGIR